MTVFFWPYSKSNIGVDEWLKNHLTNSGNKEHVRPEKTPFEKKNNHLP
jgi:hypothetical protein